MTKPKPHPPVTGRRWSDDRRIDVLDPTDRVYWTKFFGVDEIDLFEAIDKVGTTVQLVKEYFHARQAMLWVISGAPIERRGQTP